MMDNKMNIAIVGLGLMGGSLAKAITKYTSNNVYALSHNKKTIEDGISHQVFMGAIDTSNLKDMDMTIVCLPPNESIAFIKENANNFKTDSIVSDIVGVKSKIEEEVAPLLHSHSINYVSIHPMAGRECSGYENSLADLFVGKQLVLIENSLVDESINDVVLELMADIGFKVFKRTSASHHDKIIAYTSEMCHIASNAFIKSETSKESYGYTGGSFEDLTRVAFLDPDIWTTLFALNRDTLVAELDTYITNLIMYRDALKNKDDAKLHTLLEQGRDMKEYLIKKKLSSDNIINVEIK